MTPPRQFPDFPRITEYEQRWARSARLAGATYSQIAVGIGHTPSGVGTYLRRVGLAAPPAVRDTWGDSARRGQAKARAKQRAKEAGQLAACAEAEAAHVPVYRCECGGRRSTPPDGVCVHGQRTREGVAA